MKIVLLTLVIILFSSCGVVYEPEIIPDSKSGISIEHKDVCPIRLTDETIKNLEFGWYYNWTAYKTEIDSIEFIPMIWSPDFVSDGKCPPVDQDSDTLLVFNEPDIVSQSNCTDVFRLAEAYRAVELCYPDKKLISPAVVVEWDLVDRMRDVYIKLYKREPRIDGIAIHCYPIDGEISSVRCKKHIELNIQYLEKWNVSGGIWVTEFSGNPGDASDVYNLLNLFETVPQVERYAWFLLFCPYCITDLQDCYTGELTPLGKVYSNYNHYRVFFPIVVGDADDDA